MSLLFLRTNLCLQILQLGLSGIDSLLHLGLEFLCAFGQAKEADIVLIGLDFLLELGELLLQAIRLRKGTTAVSPFPTAPFSAATLAIAGEFLLHGLTVCGLDGIFFLERNKADSLPALFKVLAGLCIFLVVRHIGLDFLDEGLFGSEVAAQVTGAGGTIVAGGEESVAGGAETLPDLFALLARHSTNLLPLFLELDEAVAGGFPVRAVLQGLRFLDDGHLFGQVLIHGILELREGSALALKEFVTRGAETLVNFLVFLAGSEADAAPLGLNFLNFLT